MKRKVEINGKRVSLFYFELMPDEEDKYQCKICPKVQRTQAKNTGYSNLMNHVTHAHPNYVQELEQSINSDGMLNGLFSLFFCYFLILQDS